MQAERIAKRGEFGDEDLLSFISPEKKVFSGNDTGNNGDNNNNITFVFSKTKFK